MFTFKSRGRTTLATLASSAACLLALSTTAHGQFPAARGGEEQHLVRIGLGGGMTVPVSDASDAFKSGVNGQGFVLVQLPGGLPALRFALGYDRLALKPTVTNPAAPGEDEAGHSRIISGVAGLKLHLLPGPVRPYVMAGLGAFNIDDLERNAASGSTSKTNFGIDGGAGVEIKIGRLAAFAEGRIQNIYTGQNGLIAKNSIQSVPVSFGIIF